MRKDGTKLGIAWQALAVFVKMVERVQVASNKSREQQHCRSFHDLHRLQKSWKKEHPHIRLQELSVIGSCSPHAAVDHKNTGMGLLTKPLGPQTRWVNGSQDSEKKFLVQSLSQAVELNTSIEFAVLNRILGILIL